MLNKNVFDFIKYNNATVIIIAVILVIGGSVLAAEPDVIGQKQTSVQGIDNTALLAADLTNLNLDYKITKIEQDDKYYYATYSYLDLAVVDQVWQYQLKEKVRKISRKLKKDLGVYLAGQLKEDYDARLKDLRESQAKAKQIGPEVRTEVTEYSGLIGKTFDLAKNIFPGYEPVKKVVMTTPDFSTPLIKGDEGGLNSPAAANSGSDNLTKIYTNYVAEHDADSDGVIDGLDNCPDLANADQLDSNSDGVGDACANDAVKNDNPTADQTTATSTPDNNIVNPESVEIIELPAEPSPTPESTENVTPAPVIESAPAVGE